MKRGILLIAVLLLLAALGTSVLALLPNKAGLPAGCQTALDQYLIYKNVSLHQGLVLKSTIKATRPGALTQDVSFMVYGDSAHYQTDESYKEPTDGAEATAVLVDSGSRPLPYPPEEVWCALLQRNAREPQYGVAFVSLHQDIYNADWVVHEVGPDLFAPVSMQVASDLGCDLAVDH